MMQAEQTGTLSFILKGSTGNSYAFTFVNAFMMVKMNAGGPGQAVYADITVEGNPGPNGGTFIIDRLANT
jgi:hypothetical protein